MKKLSLILLLGCMPALAQSHDWAAIRTIPAGDAIRVSDFAHGATCYFLAADADTLTCEQRHSVLFYTRHTRLVFRHSEVLAVRQSRAAVSGLAGAGIGAAVGAGLGAGIDSLAPNQVEEGHLLTVLYTLLGALLGGALGHHADFLAGPVVYRKP